MRLFIHCWHSVFVLLALIFPNPIKAQNWQWAASAQARTSNDLSFCLASATDGAGNTVVVGNFSGTLTLGPTTLTSAGDRDVFVARLSPSGAWLQAVRAGGPGKDLALAVALDATGTAVVAGSFGGPVSGASGNLTAQFGPLTLTSSGNSSDVFVARLSPSGTWTQAVRAGGGDNNDEVSTVVLDGSGNVIVGGYFFSTAPQFGAFSLANANPGNFSADGFVARLSATGTWTQAVQVGNTGDDYVNALALDGNGNVAVAGEFRSATVALGTTVLTNSASGTSDIFVARLSATGAWGQAVRAGGSRGDFPTAMAFEATGTLVLAGSFASPTPVFGATSLTNAGATGTYDVFVARLNGSGTWTQATQAGGTGRDVAGGLTVEPSGTVTITGTFSSAGIAFGATTLVNAGPTSTNDIFVARLAPAGIWAQAVAAGGTGSEEAYGLTTGTNAAVTACGYISSSPTTFGSLAITTLAPVCFAARLGGLALGNRPATAAQSLTCFPNPARTQATLRLPAASEAAATLLDALGRPVRTYSLPVHATTATLDLAGLAPGLYVVRCGAAAGRLVVE